jgi:glycosyltransferase involved in cell wall biosynthesis
MKDRNKILLVCNSSWGIYKFRIGLIRQLVLKGFDVVVLAPEDRHTPLLTEENGVTFIALKWLKPTSFSLVSDARLYLELLGHYRQLAPDLIFHFTIKPNIYGSLAAARSKHVSVSVITGLGYTFLNDGFTRKLVTRMYRFALRKVKEVWFLNRDDQQHFVDAGIMEKERSLILPGEGVDEKFFVSENKYEIRPVLRFLLLARIIREKGICEYVEAARDLRARGYQVDFLLAGFYDNKNPASIPHRQFFEWMSRGIITYLGASDDVRPFIEQADCVVLPSYSEGLPLTLLEGGSMSRALIATDVPGCREVVRPGVNGFLCAPRDPRSLAAAMSEFYQLSPAERIKIVQDRFTKGAVHAIYFSGISRLLGLPAASFRRDVFPKRRS